MTYPPTPPTPKTATLDFASFSIPSLPIKSCVLENFSKKQIPGSISFVPSVVGLIIAGEVIKDLISHK